MAAPATSGHSRASAAPAYLDSIDPATGDVIARFETTAAGQVAAAVERARRTQGEWAGLPVAARLPHLRRLRTLLYDRREHLVEVVSRETGKPRIEALLADVVGSLDTADYYSRRAIRLLRRERIPHHNPAMKAKRGWVQYEPFGVIGIIAPWNYPLSIPLGQMIPAVAAGNAVVLKPSELTPWCGSLIEELFRQAEFPSGLVQVIQGDGTVGAALVEAAPDKVIFTGSVATGRRVAEACAQRLIPSVLELGGKDAMIVLDDADLNVASSAAVWGAFTNCGQACVSVERVYVDRSVAERFTELCLTKTQALKLGPGLDADVEVGPLIRESQVERVERQLRDAVARGARVLCGGRRRTDLGPHFFEPTVVDAVNHSMDLMHEETFGPVLAIRPVSGADEAVRLANDSPFGLSGSIWTADGRRGRAIASRLKTGSVMVNDVASYFGICEAPHGGRGASGWGKTHSRFGLLELVQVKYVAVDRLPRMPKPWWFGYSADLAAAAGNFADLLFAPVWSQRLKRLRGALGMVARRDRI